jgi:hypothetical protein
MRALRLLASSVLALTPLVAGGQDRHPFQDSWFWGAKGGLTIFKTEVAKTEAPLIGVEWLITRRNVALHVGLDQTYFDAVSTVADAPTRGVTRRVDIRDLRRFSVSGYAMPVAWWGVVRPYAGVGMAFNFIPRASPQGDQFASPAARDTVLQRINDVKARLSLLGTVGVQAQYRRFAPFLQAQVMPTQGRNEFLINGEGFTYVIEGGLRYNFGSSIERLR